MASRLIDLTSTLFWLCAIPSPIGEERELADAVQGRLAGCPMAGAIRRYRNSLVVPLTRGHAGRPHVALVGHLDTVRTENGPARIEGDRLFASGASDMKSGLALMMAVAEDVVRPEVNLTLVFYAREEGPYDENELGPVLEADAELASVDMAVCLEPSDNRLQLGCMGSIHALVTVSGRTAHSARPWEGENAITKAAPLLLDLGALGPRERVLDGLTYRAVTTVTMARDAGRGRNVVPDRFLLNLNHRFTPDTTLTEAKEFIVALVAGRGEVDFTDLSPAAMPNAGHPLVQALVRAGVRAVEPKQAWTDVARFASRGIAAVNFGPGENAQAHQRNESTSLPLLQEGYVILRRWLERLETAL
ncbi:MAG: succinyl-diaminopimelate desuccinylase [Myxococcales bacterium]